MRTDITPRQGPVDHSISDQILSTVYYTAQIAAVTLANSVAIDCRGRRSIRVLVFEQQAGTMTGRLAFYFSDTNIAGSDAGYETLPTQEHIVTATAITGNILEYYQFDLPHEGGAYLRIPVTGAITNGTVTVAYLFGE